MSRKSDEQFREERVRPKKPPQRMVRRMRYDGESFSLPASIRKPNSIRPGDEIELAYIGIFRRADGSLDQEPDQEPDQIDEIRERHNGPKIPKSPHRLYEEPDEDLDEPDDDFDIDEEPEDDFDDEDDEEEESRTTKGGQNQMEAKTARELHRQLDRAEVGTEACAVVNSMSEKKREKLARLAKSKETPSTVLSELVSEIAELEVFGESCAEDNSFKGKTAPQRRIPRSPRVPKNKFVGMTFKEELFDEDIKSIGDQEVSVVFGIGEVRADKLASEGVTTVQEYADHLAELEREKEAEEEED